METEIKSVKEKIKHPIMCAVDLSKQKAFLFSVEEAKTIELELHSLTTIDEEGNLSVTNCELKDTRKYLIEEFHKPTDKTIQGIKGKILSGKEYLKGNFLADIASYLQVKVPTNDKDFEEFEILEASGMPAYILGDLNKKNIEEDTNDYITLEYAKLMLDNPNVAVLTESKTKASAILSSPGGIAFAFKTVEGASKALEALRTFPLLSDPNKTTLARYEANLLSDFPAEDKIKKARFYYFEEWHAFPVFIAGTQ